MSGDLRELYQEIILDHSRHPHNSGEIENASGTAQGNNPLCGDRITVYVTLDGETVKDVGFDGKGCAISTASASMMTELLKGKTRAEAEALFAKFHDLVTGQDVAPGDGVADDEFDKLMVLSGVSQFPMRVKCATLAWHTLNAAIHDGAEDVVTTE